ncbi:MAG TPA: hypothetical protein VN787_03645 [Steroidobacteraceae bacterium]|nr:hypothetical protein [Steroidobacteraceae bacterium]
MTRPRAIRGDDLRRALAQEAARLMFEHGVDDYGFAKRKAAERLGAGEYAVLPKNSEIDAALAEYQRLFAHDTHAGTLAEQRRAALDAMQLLEEFEPRLVGPVLSGTATPHQEISLHVFSDLAEAVSLRLLDGHIPYRVAEHRVKMNADRVLQCPAVQFRVCDYPVDATVFPRDGIRQAPLSPTDGRPMRRAAANEVRALVEAPEPLL